MCLICKEWIKGYLSEIEAKRNLAEMSDTLGKEHTEEVEKLIVEYAPEKYETI